MQAGAVDHVRIAWEQLGDEVEVTVEDDGSLRTLLRDELEEQGLGVATAGSAEEAWKDLDTRRVDLVISDLRLPCADGLDLLRQVQRLGHPPAFLIVTAFGTIDQAVRCLEGADDFLTKPWTWTISRCASPGSSSAGSSNASSCATRRLWPSPTSTE